MSFIIKGHSQIFLEIESCKLRPAVEEARAGEKCFQGDLPVGNRFIFKSGIVIDERDGMNFQTVKAGPKCDI
jgi:hypothetical protein